MGSVSQVQNDLREAQLNRDEVKQDFLAVVQKEIKKRKEAAWKTLFTGHGENNKIS